MMDIPAFFRLCFFTLAPLLYFYIRPTLKKIAIVTPRLQLLLLQMPIHCFTKCLRHCVVHFVSTFVIYTFFRNCLLHTAFYESCFVLLYVSTRRASPQRATSKILVC
ncbi:hypothetical protein Hanom_Chr14g01332871 [Helianthus anomalus]